MTTPAAAAPPENRTAVIVQLRSNADPHAEAQRAAANGGEVTYVYREVFRGFAGAFSARAIDNLRRNPNVVLVEADGIATATAAGTQSPATWGLDRIDEKVLGTEGSAYDQTYNYPGSGAAVSAYVIDTGIATHDEFGARLLPGHTVINDGKGTDDCNGHGTHVAGTVGGSTYGAAQDVSLVPVRVLNCAGSGTWSGVIAGVDWVAGQHVDGAPAVANMSLGGGRNSSVDTAVKNLVLDGVTVVVAAGNSNQNACNYSPARVPEAVTVGATGVNDRRASFSNFGACLDLFAPGVDITSAWIGSTTAIHTISGTSMASPHVAGAAAVMLEQAPGLGPDRVVAELVESSTKNVVGNAGRKSPNRLLHVTAYTA